MPAFIHVKSSDDALSGFDRGFLVQQGAASGFWAGISFILFEAAVAWPMDNDIFKPFRMIASLILGKNALAHWNSLLAVMLLAILTLFFVSTILGAFFGSLIDRRRHLAAADLHLMIAGCLYAFLLWIGFYYLLAPVVGWTWFVLQTEPVVQGFIGNTFFFGGVLGWLFARRLQMARLRPPAD